MRILLVEDHLIMGRLLCRMLEQEYGHRVSVATTYDAATAALHRQEFDVLITDIKLPGGIGCRLAQNVKRFMPTMRILLLTGMAQEEVARNPDCLGFPILQKPFTLAELAHQLQIMGVS